jgi:hypothetical protein
MCEGNKAVRCENGQRKEEYCASGCSTGFACGGSWCAYCGSPENDQCGNLTSKGRCESDKVVLWCDGGQPRKDLCGSSEKCSFGYHNSCPPAYPLCADCVANKTSEPNPTNPEPKPNGSIPDDPPKPSMCVCSFQLNDQIKTCWAQKRENNLCQCSVFNPSIPGQIQKVWGTCLKWI